MASDTPAGMERGGGGDISQPDGSVTMPLERQMWGD
jgi:hypothetical protein